MAALCERYWKPIYAWFRAAGKSPHDAEDATQGFLCHVVETHSIRRFDPAKARFRTWLVACLRNFSADEHRRDTAQKRRPEGLASLEDLRAAEGAAFEPPDGSSPSDAFLDAWRRSVLGQAMRTVEEECRDRGREADLKVFLDYYSEAHRQQLKWQDVAQRHGLASAKDATRRADWVKARLSAAIRRELLRRVGSEEEFNEELRDLRG